MNKPVLVSLGDVDINNCKVEISFHLFHGNKPVILLEH